MSVRRASGSCSAMMLLLTAVSTAAGQTTERPFGRLDISLSAFRRVGTDTLTALYHTSPLAEFLLETPYHQGSLIAGVQTNRYDRRTAAGQSFTGVFPFIGWTATRPIGSGVEVSAGGRLGTMLMYFSDGPGTPAAREMELAWAAESRLRRLVGGRWAVDLSLQYRQIATAPVSDEIILGLGLTARTRMPGPARRMLLPAEAPVSRADAFDPRASGSRTLADFLRLAGGWDRSTVDGVAWSLSPLGLTPLDEPGWRVELDGAPIELGLLGTRDPSRLLLPLDLIDTVITSDQPWYGAGGLAKAGTLRLTSRPPPGGFSVSVHTHVGNEIGDPGPFRYTPGAGSNVERWGPGAATRVSWRRGPLAVTTALTHEKQSLAGDLLFFRNRPMPDGWYPELERVAPFATVALQGARGSLRALIGRSETDNLFFLPAWGREAFARDRLGYQAVIARAQLPRGIEARGAVSRSVNRLSARGAGPDFDWSVEDRWSYLEVGPAGASQSRVGISRHRRAASTGFALTDSIDSFRRIYADHWWKVSRSWRWHTGVEVLSASRRWAPSITTGALARWAETGEVSVDITRARSLPEERETFWLWASRGYDLIQRSGGLIDTLAAPVAGRITSIDAAARWGTRARGRVELEWYLRDIRGLAAGETQFRWDATQRLFAGTLRHLPDTRGKVAGGMISFSREVGTRGELRGGYRYQAAVAGDSSFRRAYRSSPSHAAHVTAGSALASDLTVWSRLDFRSARSWANWSAMAADSLHPWTPDVPARWTLELSLRKLLADGRLESHINIRAPLGGRMQYHPIGIRPRLQLWIAGELRLGTLPPSPTTLTAR